MAEKNNNLKKISKNANKKLISNTSELKSFSMNKKKVEEPKTNIDNEFDKDTFESDVFEPDVSEKAPVAINEHEEKNITKKTNVASENTDDDIKVNCNKKEVNKKGKKKKTNRMDRVFFLITQSILLAILFFTIGMLTDKMYSYLSEDAIDKQLLNEFGITFATADPSGEVEEDDIKDVPEYPVETPPRYQYPEGPTFAQLTAMNEKNPDFVCLLHIPSTMIEPITYPVLQAKDNNFYLYKDFNKQYKRSGSLFLDFRNNAETLEGHSIIYGHNMNDGSMFGNVLKYYQYEDGSFLKKHPYIYTYSLSEVSIWKVFSVYETTTKENYIQTHFESKEEYYQFIKDLHNKSFFDTDVILKETDDVLTLSTCYKFNAENGRLIVNAVRVGKSILN